MKIILWNGALKLIFFITVVSIFVALLQLFSNQKNIRDLRNRMIQNNKNQNTQENMSINNLSSIPDRTKIEVVVSKSVISDSKANESEYAKIANETLLTVEVVNSPSSTTLGLSGRSEIGSDGMLFVFDRAEQRYFWMKDMVFDLDLVWIREGKIVGITQNVPKPEQNTALAKLERYYSPGPVDMVLELPAGKSQKLSLFKGDTLRVK